MKIVGIATLAWTCLAASIGIAGGVADARMPTPSPTATPTPSPDAVFGGTAWVNGQNSSGPIVAKIGQQACGTAAINPIPDDGFSYRVEVASDQAIAGCGTPGATVSFFVAGQQAQQTAVWQPGESESLTLIAGRSFSSFTGILTINRELTSEKLEAFVGNTACGEWNRWIGVGPQYSYAANVLSNQRPGCGTEGASVSFKMLDAQGNVVGIAPESGTWHVWDGASTPQQLNLTFPTISGIKMGNVGTGDGSGESRIGSRLAVLLGLAGFAGVCVALGLRRRAIAR